MGEIIAIEILRFVPGIVTNDTSNILLNMDQENVEFGLVRMLEFEEADKCRLEHEPQQQAISWGRMLIKLKMNKKSKSIVKSAVSSSNSLFLFKLKYTNYSFIYNYIQR